MQNITTKKIPYSITKNQLVDMCYPMPEKTVRDRINDIIYDTRKDKPKYAGMTRKQVIATHTIERAEIKKYFDEHELPPGLEL